MSIELFVVTISSPIYPREIKLESIEFNNLIEENKQLLNKYTDNIYTKISTNEGDDILKTWQIPYVEIKAKTIRDYLGTMDKFNKALYYYISHNQTSKFIFMFQVFIKFLELKHETLYSDNCLKFYTDNNPCNLNKEVIETICESKHIMSNSFNIMGDLLEFDRLTFEQLYITQVFDLKMLCLFVDRKYRGHIYIYESRDTTLPNDEIYFVGIRSEIDSAFLNFCSHTNIRIASLLTDGVKDYAKSVDKVPVLIYDPLDAMERYMYEIGAIKVLRNENDEIKLSQTAFRGFGFEYKYILPMD